MEDSKRRLERTGKGATEGERDEEDHQRKQKYRGKCKVEGHQAKHEREQWKNSLGSRRPKERRTSQGGGSTRRPLRK